LGKDIQYAFTEAHHVAALQNELAPYGIKVFPFETAFLKELEHMARGSEKTAVLEKLSSHLPDNRQYKISHALDKEVLPFYSRPFPKDPFYLDSQGAVVKLANPIYGHRLTREGYLSALSKGEILPRSGHGKVHALRTAIGAQIINNLSDASPLSEYAILAAAAHDWMRQDEGEDHWDKKSGEEFYTLARQLGAKEGEALALKNALTYKDARNQCDTHERSVIHDADCLEINRYLTNGLDFRKNELDFFNNNNIKEELKEKVISEWSDWIRLTDTIEYKKTIESTPSAYLKMLEDLNKQMDQFPTLTNLLKEELHSIQSENLKKIALCCEKSEFEQLPSLLQRCPLHERELAIAYIAKRDASLALISLIELDEMIIEESSDSSEDSSESSWSSRSSRSSWSSWSSFRQKPKILLPLQPYAPKGKGWDSRKCKTIIAAGFVREKKDQEALNLIDNETSHEFRNDLRLTLMKAYMQLKDEDQIYHLFHAIRGDNNRDQFAEHLVKSEMTDFVLTVFKTLSRDIQSKHRNYFYNRLRAENRYTELFEFANCFKYQIHSVPKETFLAACIDLQDWNNLRLWLSSTDHAYEYVMMTIEYLIKQYSTVFALEVFEKIIEPFIPRDHRDPFREVLLEGLIREKDFSQAKEQANKLKDEKLIDNYKTQLQ
jgi:hypothetical protein